VQHPKRYAHDAGNSLSLNSEAPKDLSSCRTFGNYGGTGLKYCYSANRDLKSAPLHHNHNVPPKHEKRLVYSAASIDDFSLEMKFFGCLLKKL
jgi:hypothetical protein